MTLVLFGHDLSGATAARPTNVEKGQIWTDETLGITYVYDGTNWIPIGYRAPTLTVTADTTLTLGQAGTLVEINAAASKVMTLPALTGSPTPLVEGVEFTFVHKVATTGGVGHTIDINGVDTMRGNGITPSAGKGLVCTQATSKIGDAATVKVIGGVWYITSVTGTWAREA